MKIYTSGIGLGDSMTRLFRHLERFRTLTPVSTLRKYFPEKLKFWALWELVLDVCPWGGEYLLRNAKGFWITCIVFRFCCGWNPFAWAYYTICWDVDVKVTREFQKLPRQSIANCYKTLACSATKVYRIDYWLVAWQRLHVLFFAPKGNLWQVDRTLVYIS